MTTTDLKEATTELKEKTTELKEKATDFMKGELTLTKLDFI